MEPRRDLCSHPGVRIGLYVSAEASAGIDAILARFAAAERDGFATAWTGQLLGHDALVLLALAGRATRRIELGTWVMATPPRHPVALAQQAATAQAAAGGRLALGIGVSHDEVVARRLGLAADRPLARMREFLAVLRPLLAGEAVDQRGEFHRVRLRLDLPPAKPPPILLGALGPRMLELAGAAADGAAIWLAGPRALATHAIPRARAAAEAFLAPSARLPAYQRILAREGAASPADVALLGAEDAVARGVARLAELGATDFAAVTFPVEGDPDAPARTRRLLAELARRNGDVLERSPEA